MLNIPPDLAFGLMLGCAGVAIIFAWRFIIGLRGEEIRSLCVVTMIAVLTFSLARFDGAKPPWHDAYWLLAVIAMATIALISWGAQHAKMRVAQAQIEIGREPAVAQRMFKENVARPLDFDAEQIIKPDDPDA